MLHYVSFLVGVVEFSECWDMHISFFYSDKFHVKNFFLSWQNFVCIISNIRRYSPTVSGLIFL